MLGGRHAEDGSTEHRVGGPRVHPRGRTRRFVPESRAHQLVGQQQRSGHARERHDRIRLVRAKSTEDRMQVRLIVEGEIDSLDVEGTQCRRGAHLASKYEYSYSAMQLYD